MRPPAPPCSRRRFLRGGLALAGLGLVPGCNASRLPWQQAARVPRIGYLGAGLSGPYPVLLGGFRRGLRDLGYLEGETILGEDVDGALQASLRRSRTR